MPDTQTLEDFRNADIFDSLDVIARIAELEGMDLPAVGDVEDEDTRFLVDELETLRTFADEASGYASDWEYGEQFIRDSYFTEYAQELADDIGAIDRNAGWPSAYIDWNAAADALRMDYTSVELDGVTFWTR